MMGGPTVMVGRARRCCSTTAPQSPSLVEEVDGVWFGNVGGLSKALQEGATAVVSLCRMGRADVPKRVEHLTVGLIDKEGENPNLAFILANTAGTVAALADEGQHVFVHCVAARTEPRRWPPPT